MDQADCIVKKVLEIVEYFEPEKWWLETPRTGLLARRDFMMGFPFVDCDFCQFVDCGFQKPTRFFGSAHLALLSPKLCDGKTCSGLVNEGDPTSKNKRRHRERLGGRGGNARKMLTYPIPCKLVEYVSGLTDVPLVGKSEKSVDGGGKVQGVHGMPLQQYPHRWVRNLEEARVMRQNALPGVSFEDDKEE